MRISPPSTPTTPTAMFLVTPIVNAVTDIGVLVWDTSLTLANLVTPSRKAGFVVPEGHPGVGGKWPEFIAPNDGDSRCSCPALNAMANHGTRRYRMIIIQSTYASLKASSLAMARTSHSRNSITRSEQPTTSPQRSASSCPTSPQKC